MLLLPMAANAFDCRIDTGIELLNQGKYASAVAFWQSEPDSWSSRAGVRLMSEWGSLVAPLSQANSLKTAESDLSNFVSGLSICPNSRKRAANLLLGTAAMSGLGMERSPATAKAHFKVAERKNDALAMLGLAALSRTDGKQRESTKLAYKALEKSTEVDHFLIGQLLYRGCIFQRDRIEAAKWFEAGAAGNDWRSQRALAFMLLLGKDVPKDVARAEKLMAAADANPAAAAAPSDEDVIVDVRPGN